MKDEIREARRLARIEIGVVLGWPALLGFLWIARPGFMGGGLYQPWYADAPVWLGWLMYAVGLAWMIRIYRSSHLEPDPTGWRYRS